MEDLSKIDVIQYNFIVETVEAGNRLEADKKYDAALAKYFSSLEMLPEPKIRWDLYNWIVCCICGVYLEQGEYESAKEWGVKGVESKPLRDTSSYIELGACYLGLGEKGYAYDYFKKAFDLGARRAFQGFDKKYLDFFMSFKEV